MYTTNGSSQGNGALTYPIGLINADEVAYAGGVYGTINQSYYLYTNQGYWTISPHNFNGTFANPFFVDSNGMLNVTSSNGTQGIRPVINLKANVTIQSGTGTAQDPYII